MALQVQATCGDPLSWRVTSVWRGAAERDAFLEGECLSRVLAEALSVDLIAHLESAQEPLREAPGFWHAAWRADERIVRLLL